MSATFTQEEINVREKLNTIPVPIAPDVDKAYVDEQNALKAPKEAPVFTSSITEEVYEMTGLVLDPANGTIQYKILAANETFTDGFATGQSISLRISGGDAFSITWPTITWIGGAAPTLTANCEIVMWKEQAVLYGMFSGSFV